MRFAVLHNKDNKKKYNKPVVAMEIKTNVVNANYSGIPDIPIITCSDESFILLLLHIHFNNSTLIVTTL